MNFSMQHFGGSKNVGTNIFGGSQKYLDTNFQGVNSLGGAETERSACATIKRGPTVPPWHTWY